MAPGRTRIIEIEGGHRVWTRRVGSGPIRILLLHGGPGCSHEYFECFEQHLPADRVELYYYDQLGSYYSDQPDDPSLWTVARFREEVEQVRRALGLERFFLLGHSWGGMLAIEYSLKYQAHLQGLVISNMTASIAAYVRHINELRQRLPAELAARLQAYEARGEYEDPDYQALLQTHLYRRHICRLQVWPDPLQRCMDHLAQPVYTTMQGPNEFLVTGNFRDWDRWDDLGGIRVPTLLVVGRHDTMRVEDIQEMGRRIPGAGVAVCERGSHCAMYDDAEAYFSALRAFLPLAAGSGARP